jgi:hypothetical protein
MMADLLNHKLIWAKAILFLALGVTASSLLIAEAASTKAALLLAVSVWAFCRLYYFAFYVINHYLDPTYRFSGLISVILYILRKREMHSP